MIYSSYLTHHTLTSDMMVSYVKTPSHDGRKKKLSQMVVATQAWRGTNDVEMTLSKVRNALFTSVPTEQPRSAPKTQGRFAQWLERTRRTVSELV